MAMIEVENLTKKYRDRVAIDALNFTIDEGEIVGFLGPNGAGKSTTMKILTGFMPPTSGKAKVAGFDVFEQPLEAKRRIGYLPETPPLYPELTVRGYLKFVAELKGVPRREGEVGDRARGRRHRHRAGARPAHRRAVQGLPAAGGHRAGACWATRRC